LAAVSKLSSAISKIIGKFTNVMHKILTKIAAAGDKAIRSVAAKTSEKQAKKKKLSFKESAEDYEDDDTEYNESWEDEIDAIIASL
jgi:histidinol dehydrogenase